MAIIPSVHFIRLHLSVLVYGFCLSMVCSEIQRLKQAILFIYFAEAARLELQNFLFVITVIWFRENWSCQVGELVVYQIIRAKLMFNFSTWIHLATNTSMWYGIFIHMVLLQLECVCLVAPKILAQLWWKRALQKMERCSMLCTTYPQERCTDLQQCTKLF